jgi:hypothetical protein
VNHFEEFFGILERYVADLFSTPERRYCVVLGWFADVSESIAVFFFRVKFGKFCAVNGQQL